MGKFSRLAFWRKSKTDVLPMETVAAGKGNSEASVDIATAPSPQTSQRELETLADASLPTLLGTPPKPSIPVDEIPVVRAFNGIPREVVHVALQEAPVAVATALTSMPNEQIVPAGPSVPAGPLVPAAALAPAAPLEQIGEDASASRRLSSNSSLRKKDATPRKPVSFDSKVAFDVPPEQLWQEASEVWGPKLTESLQSSKWDKRVQALKATTATLKASKSGRNLQKNQPVRRWRSMCQVLNLLMRDKVMPVRLEAHAVFVATFVDVSGIDHDEVHYALGTLLEHLIDKLGDSNLRLHESARKCVLFTAEQQELLGLGAVLERLKGHLVAASAGSDRVKVHFGILDTVDFLLQHFPGRRSEDDEDDDDDTVSSGECWTQRDVSPFIVAGMCDSLGQRVRASAVKLAVTVYSTFGLDAMQPMLVGLRPAKQQLLKQKFEESELDDHDKPEEAGLIESGKPLSRGGSPACGSGHKGHLASGRKATVGSKATRVSPAKASNSRDLAGHTTAHPAKSGSKRTKARCSQGLAGHAEREEDDRLMDHILEDAGMVFGGNDACAPGCSMLPGMLDPLLNLEELEEHCFVEQQLREFALGTDTKRAKGSGRANALPCVVPPLSGSLPMRIDADDHNALRGLRTHSYTKGGKMPAAPRMRTSPLAVC